MDSVHYKSWMGEETIDKVHVKEDGIHRMNCHPSYWYLSQTKLNFDQQFNLKRSIVNRYTATTTSRRRNLLHWACQNGKWLNWDSSEAGCPAAAHSATLSLCCRVYGFLLNPRSYWLTFCMHECKCQSTYTHYAYLQLAGGRGRRAPTTTELTEIDCRRGQC